MKTRAILCVMGALTLSAVITTANAATISFSQTSPIDVLNGDLLTLSLGGSGFGPSGTDAGEAALSWDPTVLSYVGATIPSSPWDTQSIDTTNVSTGTLDAIFVGTSGSPVTDFLLAEIQFDVVGNPGDSTGVHIFYPYGFGWQLGGNTISGVTLEDAVVDVQAVPIPAAGVLLLSGIGFFALISRRRVGEA